MAKLHPDPFDGARAKQPIDVYNSENTYNSGALPTHTRTNEKILSNSEHRSKFLQRAFLPRGQAQYSSLQRAAHGQG
jgi:hypothetical protein